MDKTNISINKIHWLISLSFSLFYTINMAAFVQINYSINKNRVVLWQPG